MQSGMQRDGFSIAETVIALVLLGAIIASVSKFSAYVDQGIQNRWLALRLQWELDNAREIIGSWSASEITQANVQQLGVSAELAEILENPRWAVTIEPQQLVGQSIDHRPDPAAASTTPAATDPTAATPDTNGQIAAIPAIIVRLQLHAGYRGQQIKPVELDFWVLPQPSSAESAKAAAGSSTNADNSDSPGTDSAKSDEAMVP